MSIYWFAWIWIIFNGLEFISYLLLLLLWSILWPTILDNDYRRKYEWLCYFWCPYILETFYLHIMSCFQASKHSFSWHKDLQNSLVNGNFVEQKENIRKSVLLIHIHRFDSIKVNPLWRTFFICLDICTLEE